jgi:protein-disulfide isomerase
MKPGNKRLARRLIVLLLLATGPATASGPSIDIGSERGEISKAAYFKPGLAPVRQSGAYDVTIVYFMDYQCPACRKYTPDVARAFREDSKVRVIYRDTPIFGPRSEAAARVAIASQFQGKHEAMHAALMTTPLPLDEVALKAAARKAGVDWDRLQSDLEKRSDEINLQIAWNDELAQSAGIAGTPAFIIGDTLADGVLNYEGLKAEIADARRAAPSAVSKPADASPIEKPKANPEPVAERKAAPAAEAVHFEQVKPQSPPERPGDGEREYLWSWLGALAAAAAAIAFVIRGRIARVKR